MPDTNEIRQSFQHELELIAQARDELKLQMHLARAEAKSEWTKLESKWQRIQEQLQQTRQDTEQPVKELSSAAKTLLEELRTGYARVREQLRERHN